MKPDLSRLEETNLVEHPFKRDALARFGTEYTDFDFRYFDDPTAKTGFSGYQVEGNSAEGSRDFEGEAARIASIPGVRTVLDVGCAKGFLVRALRDAGIDAHGVDVSAYAVSCADPETRQYLRVMAAQDIPLWERYDLVHASGILLYLTLSELRSVLAAFSRITTMGVLFDEPTREHFIELYDRRDPGAIDPLRKQELSRATWNALFREAGFTRKGFWYRKAAPRRARVKAPVVQPHAWPLTEGS